MSNADLSQFEADTLLQMEKHRVDDQHYAFPFGGDSLTIDLQSPDKREQFILDVSRGRIDFSKIKYQNRARQIVVLARIDLAGAPHRNPDDVEVPCPHLHVYREGFGDKFAVPLPNDDFPRPDDIWGTLEDFQRFCKITRPPLIDQGLF